MDPFKQAGTSQRNNSQGQYNPFARALAETEKRSFGQDQPQALSLDSQSISPDLSLGGSNQEQNLFNADQPNFQQQSFETLKKQKETELKHRQMREKLHKMVNPVEQTDIFDAREEQRKKQINEVRQELKKLAGEIAMFYKEIDVTLTQNVASTGMSGAYHQNFFDKLRQIIIMLRQHVRSARTWAKQMKAKKKKRGVRQGLDFNNNEAKATHDMLHHERSNAYTGA